MTSAERTGAVSALVPQSAGFFTKKPSRQPDAASDCGFGGLAAVAMLSVVEHEARSGRHRDQLRAIAGQPAIAAARLPCMAAHVVERLSGPDQGRFAEPIARSPVPCRSSWGAAPGRWPVGPTARGRARRRRSANRRDSQVIGRTRRRSHPASRIGQLGMRQVCEETPPAVSRVLQPRMICACVR
jgi:hypothetical protein